MSEELKSNEQFSLHGEINKGIRTKAIFDAVDKIRQSQLMVFEQHMKMEIQPGPDVDFGFMDGSVDVTAVEKMKSLSEWFHEKETKISELSKHVDRIGSEVSNLNSVFSAEISKESHSTDAQ